MKRILLSVAALACSLWLQDDAPPPPPIEDSPVTAPSVSSSAESSSFATATWIKNIHPVRVGTSKGTAVSVAPGVLYTANHVTEGGNGWAYIAVGSQWVLAKAKPVADATGRRDGAILTIESGDLPGIGVRPAKYRESVTIFGLKTKKRQRGLIAAADMISLDDSEPGVDHGDSGGAVVADDGRLVGILRAYQSEDASLGTPANRRVVYFTRAEIFDNDAAPKTAAFPAKQSVPKTVPAPSNPNCQNGQCTIPQTQQPQFLLFRRR